MNIFLRRLLRTLQYQHLNTIEISKSRLQKNYRDLQTFKPEVRISPVLKSNAYGHGIVQIAQILSELDCPFFIVDSLFEAYQLSKARIKTPILITGYTNPLNLRTKNLPFHWCVYDMDFLNALSKYQPSAKVHLFVDTGMMREGIFPNDLPRFLERCKELKNIQIEGACSHLADGTNQKLTNEQTNIFLNAIQVIEDQGIDLKWKHLQASDGFLHQTALVGNMARIGRALYGYQSPKSSPALRMISHIVQVKNLKEGVGVGYEHTYHTKKPTRIAIVPCGYYETPLTAQLQKFGVYVQNHFCPIIGRISMNMMTIDVSTVPGDIKIGDRVEVFGWKEDKNQLQNLADNSDQSIYEILTSFADSVKRIIVE